MKSLCGILDLEKKGNREEIAERIVTFLVEPKDSGKPVPPPRPKRSSAVKANSKGYSEYVAVYYMFCFSSLMKGNKKTCNLILIVVSLVCQMLSVSFILGGIHM